jgi:hypothetical protein
VVIRRTAAGWFVEVGGTADSVDELGSALILADLLTEGPVPGPRPARVTGPQDEVDRLRASVRQLEHALASRVLVEQAIGVLTERWQVPPRDAFEHLRRVTRSLGLRIHELARTVVDSCTDPSVRLPAELVTASPTVTPPQPRRSPDRSGGGRPDGGRSSKPEPRQRQRGRRRGGTPRPREPYGEPSGQGRDGGAPAHDQPRPAPTGSDGDPPGAAGGGPELPVAAGASGTAAVARASLAGRGRPGPTAGPAA